MIGSVAGPVGACIGAGLGCAFSFFCQNDKSSAENEKKLSAYNNKLLAEK